MVLGVLTKTVLATTRVADKGKEKKDPIDSNPILERDGYLHWRNVTDVSRPLEVPVPPS